MNEYPDWVEFVTYFGLDPITVWIEYRILLYLSIVVATLLILAFLYWLIKRVKVLIASYQHSFTNNIAFYRGISEMKEQDHVAVENAVRPEQMVYGLPAVAVNDVPGFRNVVGLLLLTQTRLIFLAKGSQHDFALDSFSDANVKDGKKFIELKLIFGDRKPLFHLLGVNRDHAQEIFMKMHGFRLELKEKKS